ncbi:hypothetical protein H072_902 [Dactylellina haptotyla CBS 200.50]|uniref:Uncharacterized protein n=1 Tax=Dactylellina haptotyla (strain CBS 200.50) TaxID=1284197 RepID=S8AVV8_DACHA|nr:hypothetical protein H072_902 [Dactylellina haptotyla CBS 200.50]
MESTVKLTPSDSELLLIQRFLYQNSKENAGKKPKTRFSRRELIQTLEDRTIEDEGLSLTSVIHKTAEVEVEPYAPSVEKLEGLKKIFIEDLTMQTRHHGTIVFLRTITDMKRLVTDCAIVEDEKGEATQLQVFNLGGNTNLQELFPKGQIVAIKESMYRYSNTSIPSIRVDHFTDMVFLDGDDPMVPEKWVVPALDMTAEEFMDLGNKCLKEGKTKDAIRMYTAAVKVADTDAMRLSLLLKLSLAHLRRSEWEHALVKAELALKIEPDNEKALYRKSKALYELGQFRKCGNTVAKIVSLYPNNPEAKKDFAIVRERITEETFGVYNFGKMVAMAQKDTPQTVYDFADFTQPVYVKQSSISGFGVFTRKEVKAGDLLVCSKAFVNCRGCNNGAVLTINPEEMKVSLSPSGFASIAVLEKMRRLPSTVSSILQLHSGLEPEERRKIGESENLIIDSFLVKRIIHLNSFSSVSYYDEFPEMRGPAWDIELAHRQQMIKHSWGFACQCPLCKFETLAGASLHMGGLISEIDDLVMNVGEELPTRKDADKLADLCTELEKCYIYPAYTVPRPFLGEQLLRLFEWYHVLRVGNKASVKLHFAPIAFGAVYHFGAGNGPTFIRKGLADPDLVRAYVRLTCINGILGGEFKAKWLEAARTMYRIIVGEDSTFMDTFGDMVDRHDQLPLDLIKKFNEEGASKRG